MEETSNLQEELAQSDQRIAELKANIELGEAVERLHENEDFKKVLLEGYFEKEAKRLFEVLTDPQVYKRDVVQNMMDKMTAIRTVKQYIGVVLQNAFMAPEQLEEEQAYRQQITEKYANAETED